ncbi:hypothetical protein [Enterobacter hormaechei]|uniref:hypothetical protein n=1 Tax=Enterobacter hormaechei TaxID=158836 RepID=UPI000AD6B32B|nr:hypothetical protein [Enterobacter hormaechei]
MSNIDKQAVAGDVNAKTYYIHPAAFGSTTNPGYGHVPVVHADDFEKQRAKLEAAEKRIAELESDNAYIKNRHKELDLLIGKNILVMQAAIIEWQGTGDAKKGLAWIYNTLFGPGELPDEAEKDAQAYFDRKYAPLDEELMNLHRWFWEQSEAERAATASKGE